MFDGARRPATSIVPEGMIGYEANAWPYSRYDPNEARALLEKAGFPGGDGLPTLEPLLQYREGA